MVEYVQMQTRQLKNAYPSRDKLAFACINHFFADIITISNALQKFLV